MIGNRSKFLSPNLQATIKQITRVQPDELRYRKQSLEGIRGRINSWRKK